LYVLRKKLNSLEGIILLNAALIVEFNLLHLCNNNVILISSPQHEQIQNLKNRGLTDEQINRRIKSQMDTASKLNKIENEIKIHNYGNVSVYNNSLNIPFDISFFIDFLYKTGGNSFINNL
jgi:dephospho-CoA kinase